MIPSPVAFSPGSITGFFQPIFGSTPLSTVSKGLAFCLEFGVNAAVLPASRHTVTLNGISTQMPPVRQVLEALAPEPLSVVLETPLPVGCGLGVSSGCTLSTAMAINHRFELGMTREQVALASHVAEVTCRTGIGDVSAQMCGGIVYRHCQDGPLGASRLNCEIELPLYYRSFGPLSTLDVLSSDSLMTTIWDAGLRAVDWLRSRYDSPVTITSLLDRSRQFAEEVGLLTHPDVVDAIQSICRGGGAATMVMLGNTVLAATNAPLGAEWIEFEIDTTGARLI